MYTGFLQFLDWQKYDRFHFFLAFFFFVWLVKFLKFTPALFYRPFRDPEGISNKLTTSILIPVVDEQAEAFLHRVLDTIIANMHYRRRLCNFTGPFKVFDATGDLLTGFPDELIIIVNGADNPKARASAQELIQVAMRRAGVVPMRILDRREPSKRGALIAGAKRARGDIHVLADSDSKWEIPRGANQGTLVELLKPFAKAKIGGVTTDQAIFHPQRTALTRIANWMERIRAAGSMPAMSLFRAVGCLPGRVIAFRRDVIDTNVERFRREVFMGIFKEESDDRTLTNYALQMGYHTVYQRTARVTTDAPLEWKKYWKQQLRWSRGSQYNNLRMATFYITHPRTWYVALIYAMDTIVPFWWIGTMVNLLWRHFSGAPATYTSATGWELGLLVVGGILLSAFLANLWHFKDYPEDIPYLGHYVLLLSILLTPIRVIGFFFMARPAKWGTRKDSYTGGAKWNPRSLFPAFIGAMMLDCFMFAGPLLESPEIFAEQLQANPTLFTSLAFVPFMLFGVFPNLLDLKRQVQSSRATKKSVDPALDTGTVVVQNTPAQPA